jgi:hypothetical protein
MYRSPSYWWDLAVQDETTYDTMDEYLSRTTADAKLNDSLVQV